MYETVKAVDVFNLLRSVLNSSEGKQKCCVSRAYAVCWVTPNFRENALTAEKKTTYTETKLYWRPLTRLGKDMIF